MIPIKTRRHITLQGYKGVYIKYVGEGGGWGRDKGEGEQRVLQIVQKRFYSPGGHRPKYFMAQ